MRSSSPKHNADIAELLKAHEIRDLDLTGRNLAGFDFSGKTLTNVTFSSTTLDEANFSNAKLNNVSFEEVSAKDILFTNAELQNVRGSAIDFENADFDRAVIKDSQFDEVNLAKTHYSDATLQNVQFTAVTTQSWELERAAGVDSPDHDKLEATFTRSKISQCTFNGWFERTTFEQCTINDTAFIGIFADSHFADSQLSGCSGEGADFSVCSFVSAHITNSQFDRAEFLSSNFIGARLKVVSFQASDLSSVDFETAEIEGCNFSGARYCSTSVGGASPTLFPIDFMQTGIMFDKCLGENAAKPVEFHPDSELFVEIREELRKASKDITNVRDALIALGIDIFSVPDVPHHASFADIVDYVDQTILRNQIKVDPAIEDLMVEKHFPGIDESTKATIIDTINALELFEMDELPEISSLLSETLNNTVSDSHAVKELASLHQKVLNREIDIPSLKAEFMLAVRGIVLRSKEEGIRQVIQELLELYGSDIAGAKPLYRKLSRKYHPDVNPGDLDAEAMFKMVGGANDYLTRAGLLPSRPKNRRDQPVQIDASLFEERPVLALPTRIEMI